MFLICALSVPASHFTRPPIVPWQLANSEEDRLRDWIKKNNPNAEIYIHPNPQEGKLKELGWERIPFTWNGKQIWIQRKPKNDPKMRECIKTSA